EAGKFTLRAEPFDLVSAVRASAALFGAPAEAKGLDLHVEISPDAAGLYIGDAVRIRQVISNLLSNAVKFTQAGKITLTVSAERRPPQTGLTFEVRDTGIGFDATAQARLFSRFEQIDGS